MRKHPSNRVLLHLVAALGIIAAAGCTKTDDGSVLYCIEVRDNGSEDYFGSAASAVKQVCLETGNALDNFAARYTESWTASSSDTQTANARYDKALSAFKELQSDCGSKISALPAGLHDSFSYKKLLVLSRTEESSGEETLKSYELTLAYPLQ